jgi:putative methyltransferase (TIGR04325 family)
MPIFFYFFLAAIAVILLFIARHKLKWNGKALTPTRILQAFQVRVQDRLQPINQVRGVYDNFAQAVAAAPQTKPLGYDAANAGNWYFNKLSGVQLEDYPVIFWLKNAFADSRSVLEIGGHVGVAYYGFSTVLEYPEDLSWTILDVPTVMQAGEALALERGQTNLHFAHGGLSTVKDADIVMAVGALQYLETNLASMLSDCQLRPTHVIINETPVYDGPKFITLQNLGSVYSAYHIFNRQEFIDSFEALGYRLVDSWIKPRYLRVPGHPDKVLNHHSGFYFRAETATATVNPCAYSGESFSSSLQ